MLQYYICGTCGFVDWEAKGARLRGCSVTSPVRSNRAVDFHPLFLRVWVEQILPLYYRRSVSFNGIYILHVYTNLCTAYDTTVQNPRKETSLIYSNPQPRVKPGPRRYHFWTLRELHFCTEPMYLYRMRLEKRVPTFAFSTWIIVSVL